MGSVISTHLHVLRRILTEKLQALLEVLLIFGTLLPFDGLLDSLTIFFSSVPANFRSLVYFYGIKNGGVEEWDFAFKQFQKTTVASERRKILYGLAGASEPWILSRLVWYSPSGSLLQTNLFVEEYPPLRY